MSRLTSRLLSAGAERGERCALEVPAGGAGRTEHGRRGHLPSGTPGRRARPGRRPRSPAPASAGRRCRWRARPPPDRRWPATTAWVHSIHRCPPVHVRVTLPDECSHPGRRGRTLHLPASARPPRGRFDAPFPLSHRHHRRRLPLREHLGHRHPRAGHGHRQGGLRGPGRHQLRRPEPVRAAAKPRQRIHPEHRRRGIHARPRARPGGAEPAQVHRGDPAQERRHPDLHLWRDAHQPAHPERHPARTARLHPHVRGHAGVRGTPHHPRSQELPRRPGAAVLQGADGLRAGRHLHLALPGPQRRRGLPEEPRRPDVPPVLRREHAARRCLQRGRGTRPAAGPHRPGGGQRAQCGAHLQCRPLLLRHQRHQHEQQDGLAPHRGARRRGGGRPQLPQEHPAQHHHDRRRAGVPDAHAQPLRHHRADSRKASFRPRPSAARSPPTRCWPAWMRPPCGRAS